MVIGGAVPGAGQLDLPAWTEVLGTESHLEARELGIINVGGAGHVLVDGEKFELQHLDGLFVGRGSEVAFTGADAAFYFVSAGAHATYPAQQLTHTEVEPVALGSADSANERNLFRYASSTSKWPLPLPPFVQRVWREREADVGVRELAAQPLAAREDDLAVVERGRREVVDRVPGRVGRNVRVDARAARGRGRRWRAPSRPGCDPVRSRSRAARGARPRARRPWRRGAAGSMPRGSRRGRGGRRAGSTARRTGRARAARAGPPARVRAPAAPPRGRPALVW